MGAGRDGVTVVAETERLAIRTWLSTDVPAVLAIHNDPEVTRYLGDGVHRPITPEIADRAIMRWNTIFAESGMVLWALEERERNAVIGACGFSPLEDEIEISYHLARDAWGLGYATEAARAVLAYGFDALGLEQVIGICYPQNAASERVLQKMGGRFDGSMHAYGRDMHRYVYDAPA